MSDEECQKFVDFMLKDNQIQYYKAVLLYGTDICQDVAESQDITAIDDLLHLRLKSWKGSHFYYGGGVKE